MAPSMLSSGMSPSSPLLLFRDIPGDVNGVKTTFSSWDNCMQKDYCKWPVIVAIIIASLIVLSVLLCVVRCCCCGMECCCAACSCMNACCPSPRGGRRDRSKYRDSAPPPRQGYQPTPAPFYPTVPQFATFDASKKVHADALPAMPSWDTATSKKVFDENHPEEVEMDKIDQHDETKPMLAHGASPQMGGTAYGQHGVTPYSDGIGQDGYGGYGHQGSNPMGAGGLAAGGLAAGAVASRHQAGFAQGYRTPNGQRPGMAVTQDSFGSQAGGSGYQGQRPGMPLVQNSYGSSAVDGYGRGAPQPQIFNGGAYGQQRTQGYQSNVQNAGTTGYGQSHSGTYDNTGYAGASSQGFNQSGYANTRPSQRQEYDSYNFAPAQSQSFGSGPSPPQPTYGGQHEYIRSVGQTPQFSAPGSRGNTYAGQQSYQPYQSSQRQGQTQGQGQWRDV